MDGSPSEEGGGEDSRVMGSEVVMDVSYVQYLRDAHYRITQSIQACRVWSAPYDGKNPPPEQYQPSTITLEDPGKPRPKRSQPKAPLQSRQSVDQGPAGELEWDNSYDVALSPNEGDNGPPVPDEPPPHIKEMKKNAIMLIKGSYVEESDFQDDVMVYNLVARKDAKGGAKAGVTEEEASPGPDTVPSVQEGPQEEPQPPISNGLSPTPQPIAAEGQGGTEGSVDGAKPGQGEDDLAAQYEELIRTLGAESGSPAKAIPELRSPVTPADEEEVDFSSFSAETPESEKNLSPIGPKSPGGTRIHEVPFTGETTVHAPLTTKYVIIYNAVVPSFTALVSCQ